MKTITTMESPKIIEIWHSLKHNATLGVVKRLLDKELPIQVYATYSYPDDIYGIAVSFSKDIKIDISSLRNLSEMKIVMMIDSSLPNQKMLHIQLLSNDNIKVFSSLCENLVETLYSLSEPKRMVLEVVNQLHRWKNLFGKINSNGLSKEEQQGLYGELYFLKKILFQHKANEYNSLVDLWVGAQKASKDFQGDDWAVEVKTSSGRNTLLVDINGEHQLDETSVANLFVFHLSVEIPKSHGCTLPMMVRSIKETLLNNISALSSFEAKLCEAGYFDRHEEFYTERSYITKSERYYKVSKNFPRIIESDLRQGVSNVYYQIAIGMCEKYLVPEETVLNIIDKHE